MASSERDGLLLLPVVSLVQPRLNLVGLGQQFLQADFRALSCPRLGRLKRQDLRTALWRGHGSVTRTHAVLQYPCSVLPQSGAPSDSGEQHSLPPPQSLSLTQHMFTGSGSACRDVDDHARTEALTTSTASCRNESLVMGFGTASKVPSRSSRFPSLAVGNCGLVVQGPAHECRTLHPRPAVPPGRNPSSPCSRVWRPTCSTAMREVGVKHLSSVSGVSVVISLLVVSVGVNVLQAQKIRTLVGSGRPAVSVVGRSVQSINGASLDGQPVAVTLRGQRPTLIYHFSTSCGWCDRNWANLEAIATAAGGRYQVLAVSREQGVKRYVHQRALSVDVIEQLGAETERQLSLTGTPKTILVGADGIVTHEWVGAYADRVARQIEDLFDVRLPGLTPAVSTTEDR